MTKFQEVAQAFAEEHKRMQFYLERDGMEEMMDKAQECITQTEKSLLNRGSDFISSNTFRHKFIGRVFYCRMLTNSIIDSEAAVNSIFDDLNKDSFSTTCEKCDFTTTIPSKKSTEFYELLQSGNGAEIYNFMDELDVDMEALYSILKCYIHQFNPGGDVCVGNIVLS